VLIGGFAVVAHGGVGTTKDIDLLIDADPANVARVRQALQILEDRAVDDVADEDVARYPVVRVAERLTMRYPDGAFGGASEELGFSVPMPPAAPPNLTVSVGGRTLTLSWTPPAGGAAVEYIAEAGSASGLTDLYNGSIGTTPGITAAVAPATYHIRIRARNAGGVSPPSNEAMVVVP
jgi:hypothetical protein